jgi:hypothetical protein
MENTVRSVVACFTRLEINWCLAGAHAVGIYSQPRATQDFDFIVDDRRLKRLLAELEKELGELGAVDVGAAVRLTAIDVDLIRSSNNELFREAILCSTEVEGWRVPPVEMLIVLKFLAAISHWRGRDQRAQDIVDLMRIYRNTDPEQLDRSLLNGLAGKVYPGAEQELASLLNRIEAGEEISI